MNLPVTDQVREHLRTYPEKSFTVYDLARVILGSGVNRQKVKSGIPAVRRALALLVESGDVVSRDADVYPPRVTWKWRG